MSRDYVTGRGSRDVWTSDAALVGGGSGTSGLATQIVWGVGPETFAFDAALEGGGTETDCTSDAAHASCLFMLELNFHSGSSIYSSQWFVCLASHTSRSNSPVTHPSYSFPFQTSDAALVGGGTETSGLATQIVWGVGPETFAFDAALEGGGTETDCTSDAAHASCLFMLELNFHSGSSIYSSQSFVCLASHTSRSNSPVTHPSYSFPFQPAKANLKKTPFPEARAGGGGSTKASTSRKNTTTEHACHFLHQEPPDERVVAPKPKLP
ncbi:hypothetical protein DY000_02049311 [Brassica cretica]|uniref:Uncharacterized protein n=1 Tax=Brassica cretica TaxID=69181 RepID=A0ABQ7F0Q8_BRACR|nr:hypothetical protein DY000_02049311 [Brassica cretica]